MGSYLMEVAVDAYGCTVEECEEERTGSSPMAGERGDGSGSGSGKTSDCCAASFRAGINETRAFPGPRLSRRKGPRTGASSKTAREPSAASDVACGGLRLRLRRVWRPS